MQHALALLTNMTSAPFAGKVQQNITFDHRLRNGLQHHCSSRLGLRPGAGDERGHRWSYGYLLRVFCRVCERNESLIVQPWAVSASPLMIGSRPSALALLQGRKRTLVHQARSGGYAPHGGHLVAVVQFLQPAVCSCTGGRRDWWRPACLPSDLKAWPCLHETARTCDCGLAPLPVSPADGTVAAWPDHCRPRQSVIPCKGTKAQTVKTKEVCMFVKNESTNFIVTCLEFSLMR
jgi:hypothetical protein